MDIPKKCSEPGITAVPRRIHWIQTARNTGTLVLSRFHVCCFLLQTMSGKSVSPKALIPILVSGESNTVSPASTSVPMSRRRIIAASTSVICPASDCKSEAASDIPHGSIPGQGPPRPHQFWNSPSACRNLKTFLSVLRCQFDIPLLPKSDQQYFQTDQLYLLVVFLSQMFFDLFKTEFSFVCQFFFCMGDTAKDNF